MKLSVSQIAWLPEEDEAALRILQQSGIDALEIAPTRIAGPQPYTAPEKAAAFASFLRGTYALAISSMQSLWFGQSGNMFGAEQQVLLQYTKDAILFAKAAGGVNLVFGSPKNRSLPAGVSPDAALPFFKTLGDFAAQQGCLLSLEANPPVYGTNFMNTTAEAFAVARKVNSPGCRVNLDFGTILINDEDVAAIEGCVAEIGHVHISEPNLAMVEKRAAHKTLADILRRENYAGYISVEMKQQPLKNLQKAADYLREVFA